MGAERRGAGVVDDRVADRPVPRLPDELDGFPLRQRGQDGVDVRGQVGPDGQQGARAETGAHCVEVLLRDPVPAHGVANAAFLEEQRTTCGQRGAHTHPEVLVGCLVHLHFVGLGRTGRGREPFREEAEFARAGHDFRTGPVAAHVHVLVPPDVEGEPIPRLQSAPGALVAEHDPDQLKSDRKRDLGPVVVAGEVGREEPVEAVPLNRRLPTEVDEAGDRRFADLPPVDVRSLREGGDRRQVRRFDRSVVTHRVLGADVVAVRVAVGGVVFGDPVDECRRHASPRTRRKECPA
ncbi:hypothetical protein [Streptomyces hilarionis]|uniref:hypothetical protein n=1 Tax=Streptomyces hilarionis TaxID=2839954 RepID=UPI002119F2F7|nr:hypothetical protein [Streptomyces hilarionis]MCQ9134676.1 hypothetical protein [Streptomyces hilarionis]